MNQTQVFSDVIYFLFFVVFVDSFQSFLELRFVGRFSNQTVEAGHRVLYIFLSLAVNLLELRWHLAPLSLFFLLVRIALLWGVGAVLLKCQSVAALLVAIVAKTVNLLSTGMISSILFLTISAALRAPFLKTGIGGAILGFSGSFFTFVLIIAAYEFILRKLKWQGALPSRYFAVFFLPVLMVLIVEQYIFNQVYGLEVIIESATIIKPIADHWQMLFIQLFACFSLFSALYACRRLTEDVSNRTKILLLERETAAQRDYLEEARTRDEQTRSFRHDINHHLLVLDGLLERGEAEKAKAYLRKLKAVSETLSFPCKTGNTVVDTVLGSKLSVARQSGIEVECTVRIPSGCAVDELDLCVLFSNAVDNAIHACSELESTLRYIRISGKQKGDFLMIEMENSCSAHGIYQKGIGLSNIEAVAQKYQGAVTAEKAGALFRLSVLLVISRHLHDISVKPHCNISGEP